MQMHAILARLTQRRDELGLSDSALSLHGGSRDLIRNWRRALAKGQTISARYESLQAIAAALRVTPEWLIHGTDWAETPTTIRPSNGMAEHAVPFTLQPILTHTDDPLAALRAVFGSTATTPGLFRITQNLPGFELVAGDVVLADIARLPQLGEITLVTLADDQTATASTLVCRYLPPHLISGEVGQKVSVLRIDDPGVTVRHPVVGCLRGIAQE